MRAVQLAYSRWFNRSRRRDGSLVRGRYTSKPVTSLTYRLALVSYIDANPRRASIVRAADEYPYGSASLYTRSEGPRWLERGWVEEVVRTRTRAREYEPAGYARVFTGISADLVEVIEARSSRSFGPDPLDNLVTASSDQVRAWMVRKARLADGTEPNLPILSLRCMQELIAAGRHEPWRIEHGRVERDAWTVAYVGLGYEMCAASLNRLAENLGLSHSTVSKLLRLHRQGILRNGEYRSRAAILARTGLQGWRGV